MAMAVRQITTSEYFLDKPPSESESIGKRVRALRMARGWSLDRLAQEARQPDGTGLSRGTIWEMESSEKRIPWDATLRAIADALDVPVEYLRTGKMPATEQSLADFTPELYGRAQGIDDPEYLSVLRKQVEILKDLSARKRDEPKEDAAEE